MPNRRAKLAKLTRPRLHRALARDRLFRILDAARSRAIVWVEGPPGAGKTTLVATYLEAALAPTLWFQIDAGEADPATFFYYLREAARPFGVRRRPLPLLTPEYLGDLPSFTRRTFRDLFLRMPAGAAVVFDNYQEAPDDCQLHAVLAAAIEEVPQDANLFVLSRMPLPAALARAVVSERVARLTWNDLRLTLDEMRAIAATRGACDNDVVLHIFEQTNGWTAGAMLLLDQLQHDGMLRQGNAAETSHTTFDYFASQIFDRLSPETRDVLMAVSFLPHVTARAAEALSGNASASRTLDNLYRRHLFIDRRPGEQLTYEFHALFREFLRHYVQAKWSDDHIKDLLARTAAQLVDVGLADEAFPLLTRGELWNDTAALLVEFAPKLVAQGRWRTLETWVDALPERQLDNYPKLSYWLGRAKIPVAPREAQAILQRSYDRFAAMGNDAEAMLCAATMLNAIYNDFISYPEMDAWIEILDRFLATDPVFADSETEIHILGAVVQTATYRRPQLPRVHHCVERVLALLAADVDINVKVEAANGLAGHSSMQADSALDKSVHAHIAPLLDSPALLPGVRAQYVATYAYHCYQSGEYARALDFSNIAIDIAQTEGFVEAEFSFRGWRGFCECRAGMVAEAEATLARLESMGMQRDRAPVAFISGLKGLIALMRGDPIAARDCGLECIRTIDASGSTIHTIVFRLVTCDWLLAAGDLDTARSMLDHLQGALTRYPLPRYVPAVRMIEAHLAWLEQRREDAMRLLEESLRVGRECGGLIFLRWQDTALPRLLPLAFEHDIELQVAKELVAKYAAPRPKQPVVHWPWPLKVYTLGAFRIECDGEPLAFGRKVPKKPLALLKTLIALGTRSVPEAKIMEALWENEEGDAAHLAFEAALHRLRKILGNAAAIHQSGGALTIDADRCWVDAVAFEHFVEHADDAMVALELYRGPFLAADEDAPWAMPLRERLRGKFVRAISTAATRLEATGDFDPAITLYLRGLDADPLLESFYQGMMRCYAAQQRHSEFAGAYRRLKQTLSVLLGAAPSDASQRLYRRLSEEIEVRHRYAKSM